MISWLQTLHFHTLAKLTTSLLYFKIFNGLHGNPFTRLKSSPYHALSALLHALLVRKKASAVLWTCNALALLVLWHMLSMLKYPYLSSQRNSYLFFKPFLSFTFSVKPSLTQYTMWGWVTILSLLSATILSYTISITLITQCKSHSKVNGDSLTEEPSHIYFWNYLEYNRFSRVENVRKVFIYMMKK